MAHSVSARKRVRQANRHRAQNGPVRANFRTHIKRVQAAIDAGDKAAAQSAYLAAVPVIDRVASKGLIHKNKAARHKSRLNKAIQGLS